MYTDENEPFGSITPISKTQESYNYLSPTSYRVVVPKLPKMTYFVQSISIPSVALGSLEIPTFKGYPKQEAPSYLDITDEIIMNFAIDENMENWNEVFTWMSSMVPSSQNTGQVKLKEEQYSQIIVLVYTNAKKLKKKLTFHKCYPSSLSSFEFNSSSTEIDPIIVTTNFQYSHFDVETF
jgi:hypothetical protein